MPDSSLVSRRRNWTASAKSTVFVEWTDHLAWMAELGDRVFVLGRPPRRADILAAARGLEARVYLDGHFPVIHLAGGTITWAATWFGDGNYNAADCYDVWRNLTSILGRLWKRAEVGPMGTPATTGRDLWCRTIGAGVEFPVMPAALQSLIRAGSGQGRIETMPAPHPGAMVTLHEYDARLAYLGVTRRMPVGMPMDVQGLEAREAWDAFTYQPGRYLVTFSVPATWSGPGILPVPAAEVGEGWTWPATPGHRQMAPVWVEGTELWVAHRYGWPVDIHRAIVWDNTADVFQVWQGRLLKAMEEGARLYAADTTRATMFRSAVRAIALQAIGAMHGAPHKVTGIGKNPPEDAQGIAWVPRGDGTMTWWTNRPPAWPELVHPEWTATIWGRARARLLDGPKDTGALHLVTGSVVAFRTDAIYTSRPTSWDALDDGAPGRYRLKGTHGPVEWPTNGTDVLAAKAGV